VVASVFTESLSRWLLAIALLATSFLTAYWAFAHSKSGCHQHRYRPHLIFLSWWSLLFGLGMAELAAPVASPLPTAYLREWLNFSATATTVAWALLAWRLIREWHVGAGKGGVRE